MATETSLTLSDLFDSAILAIDRDGRLSNEQINILALKAIQIEGANSFWEWYVRKWGVPKEGQRGFGAGPDAFAYYYFEDLNNVYGK